MLFVLTFGQNTMKSATKILALLGITFALSACGTLYGTPEDELPRYSEPRFNTETPIELKVSKIDVVSEFTPTFTRPHVEHLFPVSIEKTAKLWAKDRLKAADFSSPKIALVCLSINSERLPWASSGFQMSVVSLGIMRTPSR